MIATATTSRIRTSCTSPLSGRVTIRPRQAVYFFLDFKNIARGAETIAGNSGDVALGQHVRIHAGHLKQFVERDRLWRAGYGAAALCGRSDALRHNFEKAGIDLHVYEPGRESGREQGVDEIIQGEMRKLLPSEKPRGVVALATGDGAGHSLGDGFVPVLRDLHAAGYAIEVLSWRHCLSRQLREWASELGTIIELDAWYLHITFIEGSRRALPLGHRLPR